MLLLIIVEGASNIQTGVKFIRNLFYVDGPQRRRENCLGTYRRGFTKGDKFETWISGSAGKNSERLLPDGTCGT